mgnify:CR=1 FL=1
MVKPNVIILLHGFNSLPGAKAKQIAEFIAENHLGHKFELIAPELDSDPRKAVKEVNKLIKQFSETRKVMKMMGNKNNMSKMMAGLKGGMPGKGM